MSSKKNYIDLSKYNTKPTNKGIPDVLFEPTYLSQLFRELSDDDPVELKKARDARFGRTSSKSNTISSKYTK